MNVHKLDSILNPKRIALMGVTTNPRSVGGRVLSNLIGSGYRGVVYPINPDQEAVLGIPCYSDLNSLPNKPDLSVICAPAGQVPGMVRACGEAGIFGVIIMSAGFKEAGKEGEQLEERIVAEKKRFEGMRIVGPNCLGIIAPHHHLNASFAGAMPPKGHVAFISQSGALCTSVLDWALEGNIGFSYFISIGNTIDVDFGDLIDYCGEDENTQSIILYVESIRHARKFMTAARAFARNLPIIVYKAGRFPESAEVAASHTGALASEDAVYDAAFKRAGLTRVYNIGEIFACAELIGRKKIPSGPKLGIVTNAGGPGVMATDALIASGGVLSKLDEDTINKLDENLPPMWSHGNPVDVLGDAPSKRLAKAVQFVLNDSNVNAILVILTPQAMTNPTAAAKAIGQLAESTTKPILAAWLGGKSMREGLQILSAFGVAAYSTPEEAVGAFMTLVDYAKNLQSLYETPKDIPVSFTINRQQFRQTFDSLISSGGTILSEDASKSILEAYGIPVARSKPAFTKEAAIKIADETGYPVVLKILSPDITHKSDAGGVMLDLQNGNEVGLAYDEMVTTVQKKIPDADIQGVTVQPMVDHENGVELILGIKKDVVFGTILLVGMGGITAELVCDKSIGLPPLNERLTRRMLESLKIWPLLNGYRGKPPVQIDRLIEILIRLSYLAADFPEIAELDINPLLVKPDNVIALDGRIVIDKNVPREKVDSYSHLALRPYPEEYVKSVTLDDGTGLVLRPIKPEDEPMWFDLLKSCSKESIYMRFRYFFHWETHEVASRYCFIDYDREIAIVAEKEIDDKKALLGVGRLVADPDLETVEYAILVTDTWQNRGLGGVITDYCLEISKKWGPKKIIAQTTTDNPRMVQVFRKRGFHIEVDNLTSQVTAEKSL